MKFGKGYCAKVDDRFSIHIAEDTEGEIELDKPHVLKAGINNTFLR